MEAYGHVFRWLNGPWSYGMMYSLSIKEIVVSEPHLLGEVKWRGSTYKMEKVEDGKVYWFNPVSRHRDSCSIEAWKHNDPYDKLSK